MLARVDATGIVSAGEYALTSLATVVVKSFLDDEQLTRESLALLTGARNFKPWSDPRGGTARRQ